MRYGFYEAITPKAGIPSRSSSSMDTYFRHAVRIVTAPTPARLHMHEPSDHDVFCMLAMDGAPSIASLPPIRRSLGPVLLCFGSLDISVNRMLSMR